MKVLIPFLALIWLGTASAQNKAIDFVGTIDGKYFYQVTREPWSPWFGSRSECESFGMKLAEFNQSSHINAILPNLVHGWIYWIGGRDAQLHRQFSWDSTNEEINNIGPLFSLLRSCLGLHRVFSTYRLESRSCSEQFLAMLCEYNFKLDDTIMSKYKSIVYQNMTNITEKNITASFQK